MVSRGCGGLTGVEVVGWDRVDVVSMMDGMLRETQ